MEEQKGTDQDQGSVLKLLGPTITNAHDRTIIREWIKKLFGPDYQTSPLKEKRNRYLVDLTITLLLDEVAGVFEELPPSGVLVDLNNITPHPVPAAEWESDRMWSNTLQNLPENFQPLHCSVHNTREECNNDHKLDQILDHEFQLYLYMARPYASMLSNANDRTRVATWLQILCSIHGDEHCSSMKAIRNDYIMLLLGYLQDLRAVGPFVDYPSWKTLEPLVEAAKSTQRDIPITDPTGPHVNEFLMDQPMPEDGAFCYIALTGDLITSALQPQ